MVILSGQVASHLIGEDAFQETDMVGISSNRETQLQVRRKRNSCNYQKHFISQQVVALVQL